MKPFFFALAVLVGNSALAVRVAPPAKHGYVALDVTPAKTPGLEALPVPPALDPVKTPPVSPLFKEFMDSFYGPARDSAKRAEKESFSDATATQGLIRRELRRFEEVAKGSDPKLSSLEHLPKIGVQKLSELVELMKVGSIPAKLSEQDAATLLGLLAAELAFFKSGKRTDLPAQLAADAIETFGKLPAGTEVTVPGFDSVTVADIKTSLPAPQLAAIAGAARSYQHVFDLAGRVLRLQEGAFADAVAAARRSLPPQLIPQRHSDVEPSAVAPSGGPACQMPGSWSVLDPNGAPPPQGCDPNATSSEEANETAAAAKFNISLEFTQANGAPSQCAGSALRNENVGCKPVPGTDRFEYVIATARHCLVPGSFTSVHLTHIGYVERENIKILKVGEGTDFAMMAVQSTTSCAQAASGPSPIQYLQPSEGGSLFYGDTAVLAYNRQRTLNGDRNPGAGVTVQSGFAGSPNGLVPFSKRVCDGDGFRVGDSGSPVVVFSEGKAYLYGVLSEGLFRNGDPRRNPSLMARQGSLTVVPPGAPMLLTSGAAWTTSTPFAGRHTRDGGFTHAAAGAVSTPSGL